MYDIYILKYLPPTTDTGPTPKPAHVLAPRDAGTWPMLRNQGAGISTSTPIPSGCALRSHILGAGIVLWANCPKTATQA